MANKDNTSHSRSQMRHFLMMCSIFATLIVITLTAAELLVRRYVDNPFKYKHEWLSRHSDRVETLILGSSHTYYGIIPDSLAPNTFNLASVSQTLSYDRILLGHYPFENLRNVILPISYFTFTDPEPEESDEWNNAINYKVYMDIDRHSDLSKYNFELSRFTLFSKKLRSLLSGGKRLSCDSLGFGLDYMTGRNMSDWEEMGLERVKVNTDPKAVNTPAQTAMLRDIADFCRERDIRLILVSTPTWRSFYGNFYLPQYRSMDSIARKVADEYGLTYLDHMKDSTYTETDFYDPDHLSGQGARKFTATLREEIFGKTTNNTR